MNNPRSDFASVRTYIATQIAGLSEVVSCDDHHTDKVTVYPAAFIGWDDSEQKGEINSKVHREVVPFTIRIVGSSIDQLEAAMEAVADLFVSNTVVTALGNLNVPWCFVRRKLRPVPEEGDKEMTAYLECELMFQRTVTA